MALHITLPPEILPLIAIHLEPHEILDLRQVDTFMATNQFLLYFKEIVMVPQRYRDKFYLTVSGKQLAVANNLLLYLFRDKVLLTEFSIVKSDALRSFVYTYFVNKRIVEYHVFSAIVRRSDSNSLAYLIKLHTNPRDRALRFARLCDMCFHEDFSGKDRISYDVRVPPKADHTAPKFIMLKNILQEELVLWKDSPIYIIILSQAVSDLARRQKQSHEIISSCLRKALGRKAQWELAFGFIVFLHLVHDLDAPDNSALRVTEYTVDKDGPSPQSLCNAFVLLLRCKIDGDFVLPRDIEDLELIDWLLNKVEYIKSTGKIFPHGQKKRHYVYDLYRKATEALRIVELWYHSS